MSIPVIPMLVIFFEKTGIIFMNRLRGMTSAIALLAFLFLIAMGQYPACADEAWKQAIAPRQWQFPRDHGAHPEFRTEWWYFTGNVTDALGTRFGYQVTFFRHGIRTEAIDPANPWSLRDIYPAHFAITNVTGASFVHNDRISRAGPGLAGADVRTMDVWNLDWSARMENGTIRLSARHVDMDLDVTLRPRKPLVLHGENGLSRKGPRPGQASYYYSFTDLETTGTLKTHGLNRPVAVTGTSWFDHEFASNSLSEDQAGWDWFSLHFSDGRDLMLYVLRKTDGSLEKESSGTIVEPDGRARHLSLSDIKISVLGTWQSQKTGGRYPNRWRIDIPSADLSFVIATLLPDQELTTSDSTRINYYEGVVAGTGSSNRKEVRCEGYVEMTGYAGTIGGLF